MPFTETSNLWSKVSYHVLKLIHFHSILDPIDWIDQQLLLLENVEVAQYPCGPLFIKKSKYQNTLCIVVLHQFIFSEPCHFS